MSTKTEENQKLAEIIRKMDAVEGNWNEEEEVINLITRLSEDVSLPECEIESDDESDIYCKLQLNEEEDSEKVYFSVNWNYLYAVECKCSKFIEIEDKATEEFYKNNTAYCRNCGSEQWEKGIYTYISIKSEAELEEFVREKGFEISEQARELAEKIYPTFNSEKSMDKQTAEILDKIDDKFALSNGDEFESEKEVHEYFTMETMNSMFPYSENDFTQSDLAEHAELVITNKYHCNF